MRRLWLIMFTGLGCGYQAVAADNQALTTAQAAGLMALGAAGVLALETAAYPHWYKSQVDQAVVAYHMRYQEGPAPLLANLTPHQKGYIVREIGRISTMSWRTFLLLYLLQDRAQLSQKSKNLCIGGMWAFCFSGLRAFFQAVNLVDDNAPLYRVLEGHVWVAFAAPSCCLLREAYLWWNRA